MTTHIPTDGGPLYTDKDTFVSAEFHGQDQADLGRFFLPDISPEEAAEWPSAGVSGLFDDEFEDGDRTGAYERYMDDLITEHESTERYRQYLGEDYGPTHDGYDTNASMNWED